MSRKAYPAWDKGMGQSLRIKYPDGRRVLSPDGAMVPNSQYWRRRFQYRDVVPTDPRPPKTPKKAAKAAKSEE